MADYGGESGFSLSNSVIKPHVAWESWCAAYDIAIDINITFFYLVNGNIDVWGEANGFDIDNFYEDILSKTQSQTFEDPVLIKSNVILKGDVTLEDSIDNLDLSDFIPLDSVDTVRGKFVTFDLRKYVIGDILNDAVKLEVMSNVGCQFGT